jgi:hypothetical protein
MAELQYPSVIGRFLQGQQMGRQMRAEDEARQNQSRLSQLAAQAYGAPQEDRGALIQQAIGIDPQAGISLGNQLGAQDKDREQTLLSTARLLASAPEEYRPALYKQIYPQVSAHLPGLPPEYSPQVGEGINAFIASRSGGQANFDRYRNVGGALIDLSGDPTKPIYQAPGQPIMTSEGLVIYKPGQGLEELTLGGGDTMPMPQPDASGMRIDPGLPQNVQDAIRSNPGAFDQGGNVAIPNPQYVGGQPQGRRLGPPVNAAQRQAMQLALEANQRAAEASARAQREADLRARFGAIPAGFRVNAEGTALEPAPGGPKPAGSAATEDERKAAGWFNQAQNAFKNMESALASDAEADEPGIIETYSPIEELGNVSRSPNRQRYVQASESFGEAVLRAATGAGVNKDEARQKARELTPQRGDSAQVRDQKRASLSVYLQSLQQRAGRALPAQGGGPREVTTQAEFDALPSGAVYLEDGVQYRKP